MHIIISNGMGIQYTIQSQNGLLIFGFCLPYPLHEYQHLGRAVPSPQNSCHFHMPSGEGSSHPAYTHHRINIASAIISVVCSTLFTSVSMDLSTPFSIRIRTILEWPFTHATCRGVHPYILFCTLSQTTTIHNY